MAVLIMTDCTRVQKKRICLETNRTSYTEQKQTFNGVCTLFLSALLKKTTVGKCLEVCSINHMTNCSSVSIIQIKSPLMAAQCKHTKKIMSCLLDKDGFT